MFTDQFMSIPGMGQTYETFSNEFRWGHEKGHQYSGGMLLSSAVDAGSTPTTTLRCGLLLGTVTASGLLREYAAANTDGSDEVTGVLLFDTSMLDRAGSAVSKQAAMVVSGPVKAAQLYGLDEQARQQMAGRFLFDDRNFRGSAAPGGVTAKTTSYTVTASDNGRTFTTTGAAGAVTFTLPAVGTKGLRFRFINTVNQNMAVAAPANKLIGFNGATFTSITFSTSGEKIGAAVDVISNDTGGFYIAIPLTPHTATYA